MVVLVLPEAEALAPEAVADTEAFGIFVPLTMIDALGLAVGSTIEVLTT